MSTRKPFSIRTQNELNISNKENLVNKRDIPSKKNTTKIINVKTKTNSKIYISKKEHSITISAPVQEVKNEDVENYAPAQEQAQVEKVAVSTPEVNMGNNVSSRKKYTIDQLLNMMPNVCSPPPGFENWPEAMRNPKPKSAKKLPTASNSPFKTPLVQKRSPMGEAKEKSATTTSSEPVVPVIKMPEIIIPSIKLETILPTSSPSKNANVETDERRLEQRQKQIDLGKKTLSYYMYTKKVPSTQRKKGCPTTPRKNQVCSKRSWDGQVRKWRRMLHDYDPKTPEEIEEAMKLFPEETKYLLQKRNDGEDVQNIEEDQEDCDDVLN